METMARYGYPAVGWRGISKAEGDRRMEHMLDDGERLKGPTSAVITTREALLTEGRPCTVVPVATAASGRLAVGERLSSG